MQVLLIKVNNLLQNTGQIEGLPKNPRLIKDDRYNKLRQSIKEDPEMLELRELIVFPHQDNYVVIAGNMRLEAMTELGYTEAVCKVLPDNTSVEKLKAFSIKDNVLYGEHDWKALKSGWDTEVLQDWGVELPALQFSTNLNPGASSGSVTDKDIKNTGIDLSEQFKNNGREKFEVCCPECAHVFFIDK